MKQPHRLTFADMRRIADNAQNGQLYLTHDFGIGLEINSVFPQLMKLQEPLLVEDSRIGVILSGEADVTLNLVDYHITPHTAMYIGRGSVAQFNRVSPDVKIMGMMFTDDRLNEAMHGQMPTAFNGERLHFYKPITAVEQSIISNILHTAWTITQQPEHNDETINGLIHTLLYYYDSLMSAAVDNPKTARSRERELFERFLNLINRHGKQEHSLSFYADKLCLTERYLGTAVSNASGNTAKAWIDRATITAAKVLLRHTDKSISPISDELNFPNPSFFQSSSAE